MMSNMKYVEAHGIDWDCRHGTCSVCNQCEDYEKYYNDDTDCMIIMME